MGGGGSEGGGDRTLQLTKQMKFQLDVQPMLLRCTCNYLRAANMAPSSVHLRHKGHTTEVQEMPKRKLEKGIQTKHMKFACSACKEGYCSLHLASPARTATRQEARRRTPALILYTGK